MSNIEKLEADVTLASVLDKNVVVSISTTQKRVLPVYSANKRPNNGLADEYIEIYPNGVISSLTEPIGIFSGNLAVAISVALQTDQTAKTQRIREIIEQCEAIINCKAYDGFFFKFDPSNVITPTTPNLTSGYSTTTINVKWRTSTP